MDSSILAAPTRTTTTVDLFEPLCGYIESNFKQNATQFLRDVGALDELRKAAQSAAEKSLPANPESDASQRRQPTAAYYGQLQQIKSKFPNTLGIVFSWSSSLGYAASKVNSESLDFEIVNLLYNLGACFMQCGKHYSEFDLPKASQSLQFAAGAFGHTNLAVDKLTQKAPIGLDNATISALENLCLAQAQECFWAKAQKQSMPSGILSKLAAACAQLYAKVLGFMDKTSAFQVEWMAHVRIKRAHFLAIAHYRLALCALEKSEHGVEVAHLKEANKIVKQALTDTNYISELVLSNIRGLATRLEKDLCAAEKDNNVIYLKDVPNHLPEPQAKQVVSPQQPAELKPLPKAEHLFALLLPFAVYTAPVAYRERLRTYVTNSIVNELNAIERETTNALTTLGVSSVLDAAQQRSTVPSSLLDLNNELSKQGGIELVNNSFQDLRELANEAGNQLDDISDDVKKNKGHSDAFKELVGYLEIARNSDRLVKSEFDEIRALIEILTAGQTEIAKFLPRATASERDLEFEEVCQRLRVATNIIYARLAEARDSIERARAMVDHLDLTTPMMVFIQNSPTEIESPSQLEPVYNDMVGQFDCYLSLKKRIRSEVERQLKLVEDEIKATVQKQKSFKASMRKRQEAISALEQAYLQYRATISNLDEAREFYNRVIAQITTLRTRLAEDERPTSA